MWEKTLKGKKSLTQDQAHVIAEGLKLPKQRKGCFAFLVHMLLTPGQPLTLRGHLNDMLCFILGASEQS